MPTPENANDQYKDQIKEISPPGAWPWDGTILDVGTVAPYYFPITSGELTVSTDTVFNNGAGFRLPFIFQAPGGQIQEIILQTRGNSGGTANRLVCAIYDLSLNRVGPSFELGVVVGTDGYVSIDLTEQPITVPQTCMLAIAPSGGTINVPLVETQAFPGWSGSADPIDAVAVFPQSDLVGGAFPATLPPGGVVVKSQFWGAMRWRHPSSPLPGGPGGGVANAGDVTLIDPGFKPTSGQFTFDQTATSMAGSGFQCLATFDGTTGALGTIDSIIAPGTGYYPGELITIDILGNLMNVPAVVRVDTVT